MGWVTGYEYRQKITIAAETHISADLTDLSVVINVPSSNTNFWINEDGVGTYLRFALLDGTLLKFQVESYDAVGKDAWFHVKIPTLSATVGTDIYIYYGGGSVAGDDKINTWDPNYVAVYHFNQDQAEGAFDDATGSYPATNYSSTDAPSDIDRGRRLAGGSQFIDCGVITELSGATNVTLEGVLQRDGSPNYGLMVKRNSDASHRFGLFDLGTVYVLVANGANTYGSVAVSGAKHHYIMAYDGAGATDADKLKLYVDGILQSLAFVGPIPASAAIDSKSFLLGREEPTSYGVSIYDEVTISKVTRSADWAAARNQSRLGTWLSFGTQELKPLKALSGTATVLSAIVGSFNVEIGTQGIIASATSLGAALLVLRDVMGDFSAGSNLTGGLMVQPFKKIFGELNTLSTLLGGLRMGYRLSGSSISGLLLSGEIRETFSCGGSFAGLSSMSGLPVFLGSFSPATLARSPRIDITRFSVGAPSTVQTGNSSNIVTKTTKTPGVTR